MDGSSEISVSLLWCTGTVGVSLVVSRDHIFITLCIRMCNRVEKCQTGAISHLAPKFLYLEPEVALR